MKTTKEVAEYLKLDEAGPTITGVPETEIKRLNAFYWLTKAVEAINKKHNNDETWEAIHDGKQKHHEVYFVKNKDKAGFRFSGTLSDWTLAFSTVGPRLEFCSYAAGDEFGASEEFVQLWNDALAFN